MWYNTDTVSLPWHDSGNYQYLKMMLIKFSMDKKTPYFSCIVSGTKKQKKSLEHIVKFLRDKGFSLHNHWPGRESLYLSDLGFVYINHAKIRQTDDEVALHIYVLDEKLLEDIINFGRKNLSRKETPGKVKILIAGVGGLHIETLGSIKCPFIKDNYGKDVVEGFETITREFKADTPSGRLAILQGPPGTGKSFFIRALITSIQNTFIYIPSGTVGHISGPEVIGTILEYEEDKQQPITLIFEDADASLVKREKGDPNKLSEILNISDGLLGELVNLRIIATTNREMLDIDRAALRPGRLCASVQFDALSPEQSAAVYKKLTDKEIKFTKKQTLAEIYSKAKNPEFKEHKSEDKKFGDYV